MNTLRVVFAGTPEFAVPSLRVLLADPRFTVVAVYTQPDRPAGRGQALTPPPVKVAAEQASLPVYQPLELGEMEFLKLRRLELDFLVVVAYGLILPSEMLAIPQYGCLNVHASLLPKYRGASPIQQAILNNDTETGVSYMQLETGLDTGPVFAQASLKLTGTETGAELTTQLAELGGAQLPETLAAIAAGESTATKQDDSQATLCKKIKKTDGKIDWQTDSAEQIERKLRAYTPWPGIWTEYADKRLKILEIGQQLDSKQQLGKVFEVEDKIYVQAVDRAVELKRVQLEGKRALSIQEFVRGEGCFVGSLLK